MKKTLFLISLLSLSLPAFSAGNDIIGEWTTFEGKSKVAIERCGVNYCGKIIWLKEPKYPASNKQGMVGKVKVDRENPKRSLRSRPLVNLTILTGFKYSGGNEWEDGEIYDPKNGKTYSCILTLKNKNTLDVRGYIGFSLLGRTTTWTR